MKALRAGAMIEPIAWVCRGEMWNGERRGDGRYSVENDLINAPTRHKII